ncbi:MAG: DinB family protein [Actinomycetota bacterium]
MDGARRDELITRYREGPEVVEQVVAGLSDEELDHVPADGGWSARAVIHHLADSETISAARLRLLLAEDAPVIQGYNEEELARRLHYDMRPLGPSLAALRATRESTAAVLDLLSDEDWSRSGAHTESGDYSVETWLEIYAEHAHDHVGQIERAVAEARES